MTAVSSSSENDRNIFDRKQISEFSNSPNPERKTIEMSIKNVKKTPKGEKNNNCCAESHEELKAYMQNLMQPSLLIPFDAQKLSSRFFIKRPQMK